MKLTLVLFLCLVAGTASSQLFTEVSQDLGISYSYEGGSYSGGVSFFDADHNGWDDITFCTNGEGIIYYQNINGVFLSPVTIVSAPGTAKQAIWIDYDNDGDSDLFVTRYYGKWSLYRNNGSVLNLEDVTEAAGLFIEDFPQSGGSCWGDIDNDGFLDVYIPNYNMNEGLSTNFMYLNNGDGTFTDITQVSGSADGYKASFQGLFFDYDLNGSQDLFVINDRIPFSDSFYKNAGGTFTNGTIQLGLEQYIFSMNVSISDIDHDGGYELYVSNNPNGNTLFSYNPESEIFEDISSASGTEVFDHSWAANWLDANNDTWEDLHVAVSPFWGQPGQDQFFYNNGDGTFTMDILSSGFSGDFSSSHSTAIGDFNNDGFSDLVVLNDAPSTSKVYQNNGNDNHFLKVHVEGVNCNRDAFGARIEVYLGAELLLRTKHGGECYMSQNSQYELFGLGQAEMVDSLSIIWPGGFTETTYNIPVNTSITFIEGQISEANSQVYGQIDHSNTNLCVTDSIVLTASNNDPVLWNTGMSANSIWVSSPGNYYFSYELNGVTYNSDTVNVVGSSQFEIEYFVSPPSCFGFEDGSISFNVLSDDSMSYYTINGNLNSSLSNLQSGNYELIAGSPNGCETSQSITISDPELLEVDFIVNQALCYAEKSSVSVLISGGTEPINIVWEGFDPEVTAPGIYTPFIQDINGCIATDSVIVYEVTPMLLSLETIPSTDGNNGSIECSVEGGSGGYLFNWTGPDGFFSLDQNIYNLAPGFYTLIVFDSNGCMITHSESLSPMGISDSDFDFSLYPNPVSEYVILKCSLKIDAVEMYDLNGRIIYSEHQTNPQEQLILDVSTFATGTYLLNIKTIKGEVHKTLIVH